MADFHAIPGVHGTRLKSSDAVEYSLWLVGGLPYFNCPQWEHTVERNLLIPMVILVETQHDTIVKHYETATLVVRGDRIEIP